jgi:hypothetical protein
MAFGKTISSKEDRCCTTTVIFITVNWKICKGKDKDSIFALAINKNIEGIGTTVKDREKVFF